MIFYDSAGKSELAHYYYHALFDWGFTYQLVSQSELCGAADLLVQDP